MAKLNLDLSEAGLEILTTADFQAQDAASKAKKTGGRPKSANPADKRTTMFLSSDEVAFFGRDGLYNQDE